MSNKMNLGALGFLGMVLLLLAASAALAFGQPLHRPAPPAVTPRQVSSRISLPTTLPAQNKLTQSQLPGK